MTFFDIIPLVPADPIFGLQTAFQEDPRSTKVNLSIGVYKTLELKTPVMSCVKRAERDIWEAEKNKDYLPGDGDKLFVHQVGQLVFGEKFWERQSGRISGLQSVGGTGALRVGGDLLKKEIGSDIYMSDPTWPNHRGVFAQCGLTVHTYPYYDHEHDRLNFEALFHALETCPRGSTILLHACCHNPTGKDLNEEQWKKLLALFLAKGHLPFFDIAYQGLGQGLTEDAYAVRLFAEAGLQMIVAFSCSKNFGLYGERVGAFFAVTNSSQAASNVSSQLRIIARRLYSNPPIHGAKVVAHVLSTPSLRSAWEIEVTQMRERIIEMRRAFATALSQKIKTKNYHTLNEGNGMFAFCPIGKAQVERLIAEFGIYMTSDGRINISGLTWDNLDDVVNAIVKVNI